MPFADFHGNAEVVAQLRGMLAQDRFPHALILAAPAAADHARERARNVYLRRQAAPGEVRTASS